MRPDDLRPGIVPVQNQERGLVAMREHMKIMGNRKIDDLLHHGAARGMTIDVELADALEISRLYSLSTRS